MLQTSTDAKGNPAATYAYSPTFAGAYPTTVTNALGQATNYGYDFNTGLLTSTTDPNNQTTTNAYDNMLRLTQVSYPSGQTTYCYTDTGGPTCAQASPPGDKVVITEKIATTPTVVNKTSTAVVDGLGRMTQTQLNSDPSGVTYTQTQYDGLGRKFKLWNPTRCPTPTVNCGESTWGFTTYSYDGLNRLTQVMQPDNSPVNTSYSGNCTTVTDEAGKARKSCADGLGRMTQVLEDPGSSPHLNYETDYTYDAVDNLVAVTQKGGAASGSWRNRSFVYDSLSRLLTATNPESGTITYAYDANSNLATKVAPIPNKIPADASAPQTLTTTYFYDALNRLTKKTYTDSTPTVQYGYDGVALTGCATTPPTLSTTNPKGNRTAMCDGSGATSWALDITANTGWKITESRTINGVNKTIVSQNNLGGMPSTLTYPSGRTVTFFPSAAGRVTDVKDLTNSFNYVTGATYAAPGAVASFNNGASAKFTEIYNSRVQPCWIYATTGTALASSTLCNGTATAGTLIDLKYSFNLGTTDNGNVIGITNNRNTNRSQSFTYDQLNRIATGQSQATSGADCWGQSFTIDAWGNLTNEAVTKCSAPAFNFPATTKNQISGYCYDKAGNMLGQSACPSLPYTPTYTYDGENRLLTTAGVTYTYDGDGNRVKKSNGTLYWGSGALAESDLTATAASWKDYIFFNGKRVAKRDSTTTHYFFSDHLGSASVVRNDTSGALEEDLVYAPYGQLLSGASADHYMFTGKERDTESGLDNFGARYDASSLGRFMTPDSGVDQHPEEPQSWNLYAYVTNNPLRYVDSNGKLKRDANGVIYRVEGLANALANGQSVSGFAVTIWTEKNTPIQAFIPSPGNPNWQANCHGLTFGMGQMNINNKDVAKILTDEYEPTSHPQVGDVGVYSEGNDQYAHSVTVTAVDGQGNVTGVSGVSGQQPSAVTTTPAAGWSGGHIRYYHKASVNVPFSATWENEQTADNATRAQSFVKGTPRHSKAAQEEAQRQCRLGNRAACGF